jgi:hypothetical protein
MEARMDKIKLVSRTGKEVIWTVTPELVVAAPKTISRPKPIIKSRVDEIMALGKAHDDWTFWHGGYGRMITSPVVAHNGWTLKPISRHSSSIPPVARQRVSEAVRLAGPAYRGMIIAHEPVPEDLPQDFVEVTPDLESKIDWGNYISEVGWEFLNLVGLGLSLGAKGLTTAGNIAGTALKISGEAVGTIALVPIVLLLDPAIYICVGEEYIGCYAWLEDLNVS